MDTTLKAKWVAALRSGEYKQGRQQLHKGGSFCCLGVLCKIAGLPISNDGEAVVVDGLSAEYRPLERLLGHDAVVGLYSRNDGSLDHRKHSFPEIADHIEANL